MEIYIDTKYCCHVTNSDGVFRKVEHPFFDGKCATVIEGYFFLPLGEEYVKQDGTVLTGERIEPIKQLSELATAQAQYEIDMAEADAAYQEGVNSAYDQ